ncbi:hypothetical protein DIS24_g7886 [Lasiodiplodia hormozganensis]|uniref:Uncharacterized protein n=1 Tax=Lasiodiplodia hormozganensis TaxID=869390 RepID=A0AA40CS88_9PEZI|nr:hypothetical protein DIS24_g7886 [Lasiodiplodia hormozganensis]
MADLIADSESLYTVRTGVWTDWSHGSVFGATLTLRRDDANLLIAFIALFVTIVGTRAWRICCFGLHQALSSPQPRDGLYHQLQATLRNASNVTSALVTLFQLSWAWSGLAQGWKRRLLPVLGFAVLFFTAFALASGFSSRIAANSEALISSPHCGWLDYSLNTNSSDLQSIFIPYTYRDVFTSANYAQQCYASNSTGVLTCSTFVKKRFSARALQVNGSILTNISTFEPTAALHRKDANIYIFFLSANRIIFSAPTTDDWYSATTLQGYIQHASVVGKEAVYRQDEVASPLACTDQEQFCDTSLPADRQCTPLTSSNDAWTQAGAMLDGGDTASANRFDWFKSTVLNKPSPYGIVQNLGTAALLSRSSLGVGIQRPLPTNQWQLDVTHWFETSLASIQGLFLDTATGPSDSRMLQWVHSPANAEERTMCHSQKILSTAYISFSLFGLCLILVLGTLIIIASAVLEPVAGYVQKRRGWKDYARLEWCTNETLQLQRLAHEELGVGTWSHALDAVPRTAKGEVLAVLDWEGGREHPRLLDPREAAVVTVVEEESKTPAFNEEERRGSEEGSRRDDEVSVSSVESPRV